MYTVEQLVFVEAISLASDLLPRILHELQAVAAEGLHLEGQYWFTTGILVKF